MSPAPPVSKLLEPLPIRGFTGPNRIMVSPMQQYASDASGQANDYHLVQLGRFVLGGAGMAIAEATAIEPADRMSHTNLGIWPDSHVAPLARIATFIAQQGSVPGILLVHAGRKGSMQAPWDGMGPLPLPTSGAAKRPGQRWLRAQSHPVTVGRCPQR